MALDSLGLGLTLDTTLLEKADKTLENMTKNSKLVMQNLTRGITAFNEGKIGDLSKVVNNVTESLDKLSKTKVSPDFDTSGQEKYIDRMHHLLGIVEKMSKIKGVKLFDPTEVYATDKRPDQIFAEMGELQEHKKELAEAVDILDNYVAKQRELKATMYTIRGELPAQEKEVKSLSSAYDEAKVKYEAALKSMATQLKAFTTRERKKDPSLTEEQIMGKFSSTESMKKYIDGVKAANEELIKAEEKLAESESKLEGKRLKLQAAGKEYQGNWKIKQKEEEIRLSYDAIKEQEKILNKELEYSQASQSERAAMLTKRNEAEIKADKKRIKDVQNSYEELRRAYEKGENDIADLEKSRETIKAAGGKTKEIDAEIAALKKAQDERLDAEMEFRTSKYWPQLEEIDKKYSTKAFKEEQKRKAKEAEKASRKDVTAALQYSKNAQSINEEKEAIKRLIEARDNLSSSSKRYKTTVKDINERILAHKDHIEAVTRVEKEQNTLADSVINRYRKQLKALDDINVALDKKMKLEGKTNVADLDPNDADTKALLARQKTVLDDIAAIEDASQGELDVIREQHEAERAKKRIDETIKTNEREKQEYAKLLDDLYAIEKQREAMKDAGAKVGDKAYDNILQQEQDLNNRISQLKAKHQNDLDEIKKKHDKKRNDDEVKAFIDAQKEKQRIAEEYAKKQREKASKYGTISSASADRLIGVTDKATNINQHKAAIDKLQKARASLDSTDKNYLKTVKRLNDAIKHHEIEIELANDKSKELMQTHRGLMDISGQLMRRLALVFSVSQLTQYFRKLVEVRGEFEKTEVALTTLLKSRSQANVLMNQITDLAIKSPFTLQQLVGYTKQLAAYQIEYKKLYSTTKMLADVSSGLGVEMERLILAFGQVRAANFLRATEVRQFTEAGFDILGELAKYYSDLRGKMVSVAEVQEMVTKRMVGFSDVEKVFQKVTAAGGIFYDMQAKQAETLAGQWSNLQDKISIMYNEIGKSTQGALKGIVGLLSSIIDNWEGAASVLKGVVMTFVMVKLNTALASKEMIKFVRTMGLVKGRVKAVSVFQTIGAGAVGLWRGLVKATKALKAFAINNPAFAALAVLGTIIGTIVRRHNKQKEAVEQVSKRYKELHENITKINASMLNAINEQDLDKQKESLKELVEMVDKEYNMKVNIDIEHLEPAQIAETFNKIRDEAQRLNIFAEIFGSGLEGFKASGVGTNDLLEDMSQYNKAANELFKQMVDKSSKVASALNEIDPNKYKDVIDALVSPRDVFGGESELEYLNRIYEAYKKIQDEGSLDVSFDEETGEYIVNVTDNFYDLSKILGEMDFKSLSLKYKNAMKEIQDVELWQYLETLEGSLEGLTKEDKESRLKFAIDTEAANREWNAFTTQLAYETANKKFELDIKPNIEAPDEAEWEKWQDNYKERFEQEEGYLPITSPSITQEAQIKALNEEYEKQYNLLERIKAAGGSSALEVGGAYEGLNKTMDEITEEMKDLNDQIIFLGGTNSILDKSGKKTDKILNRRISILKEIYDAYKQARKDDLGHEEAVQKVMTDWGDTFTEAFEGTSINLTSVIVDKDKLAEIKTAGEESGKVFSESMEQKMKEVFDSGTYIRKASKDILEFLKEEEGWRNKAYQDTSGIWTIGAGSTKQPDGTPIKQGDYWTDEDIWANSQKQIKEHEDRLNRVLEKHRDILLTQEQYNVLLKATWQGQGTSVIPMAKDAEEFKKWLEEIDGMPIVKILMNPDGTIKERKQVGLFDIDIDAIMQEYNSLESVYERMALVLKYTSNRMGKTKDTTQGMIDRSFKRSADFSGDTYINKMLEQASSTIADFDFSTPAGLVKALRGLIPIAKKEGKEAMVALSKEISKVENEIGVKVRLENVTEFKEDVEKAIGDYKLWKDIEKMQVPSDFASKVFGITPQTLKQMREEVLTALNLGDDINLGNEDDVLAAVKLQYGEPTEDIVRNFLKNVRQMEDDEMRSRVEKYLKYTRESIGKRAQIKVDELKKLQEIEETFKPEKLKEEHDIEKARAEGKTDEEIQLLEEENKKIREGNKEVEERNKFLAEQADLAAKAVRKESDTEIKKLDWEEFEKSETFINLFEDLDNASESMLNHMIGKLNEFKEQWKDMPLEDVNKIIDKLNELETKLAEVKPWKSAKKAKDEIKAAMGKISLEGVEELKFESKDAKETIEKQGKKKGFFEALDQELVYQEEKKTAAQEEVSLLEAALRVKEGIATVSDKELQNQGKLAPYLKQDEKSLKNQLTTQKNIVGQADKQIGKISKTQKSQKNLTASQVKQKEASAKCLELAVELGSAFKELGEALGADDPAMVFADMGLNMMTTVANTLMLQAQLQAATIAAQGLGAAINSAMGIIGWIVMAVQLLVQAISAAVNYADKMRQMKLDVLANQVDNLKKKYDELAESIENAWSYKQLKEYSRAIDKVQRKMISAQKDYISLLQEGDKNDKIGLAEQAQRKLDSGVGVEGLTKKERKALLSDEYQDYKEAADALLEMQREHEEQKSEIIDKLGGITDENMFDTAEDFVSAWLDAFKETGDGLSGLTENFDEFFENLLKKKAAMLVSEKAMQGWVNAVNNAIEQTGEGGYDITDTEQEKIRKAEEDAKKQINSILLGIFEGIDLKGGGSGLSELQKGIQGITEQQAEVIEAYLNSMRQIASDNLMYVRNIANLLESVSFSGHSKGGRGIKVFMS